jgi:hypothetical protein
MHMAFMSAQEIEQAVALYKSDPIKGWGARVLQRLQRLVDSGRCEGWDSWVVPMDAASQLIMLLRYRDNPTAGELQEAFVPIRLMLSANSRAFQGETISFDSKQKGSRKIKLLLVAEIEVPDDLEVDTVLDRFRERVLPSFRHGITMYRSKPEDVDDFNGAGTYGPWVGQLPVNQ